MGEIKNKKEQIIEPGQIAEPCNILLTQEVYDNPEQIIEAGAIDACKKLWDLNIFTVESQGRGDSSFVVLDTLDDNNKSVFKEFTEKFPKNYSCVEDWKFGKDTCIIHGDGGYLSPDLINGFVMQDVPPASYMSEQTFLMTNGNYCKYELSSDNDGVILRMFDPSKLTDTLENTVISIMKEKGIPLELYVPEEHRIYANIYCLNANKKYLNALQKGEIAKSTEFSV